MLCPRCGREIADDAGFCTYCGSRVGTGTAPPPLPMPPTAMGLPADQHRDAASQDRRLALIILGVVVGVAVLVVILAAILMLVLAANDDDGVDTSKLETRLTMQAVGDTDDDVMAASKEIIERRLDALGIEGYRVTFDKDGIYVELPDVEDIEHVRQVVGSTAQLQLRQVLETLAPGDAAYDTTEATKVDPADKRTYPALENQEIILAYENDDGTCKLKLGPTLLTGDIISSASAVINSKDSDEWRIDFSLTSTATRKFGDLTTDLSAETTPLNQLAIVLDYQIKSCPTVQSAITDGKGEITGSFTKHEAQVLALVFRLGALPVDFVVSQPEPIK